ncbi:unnamed protein product [Musa acuminata subsp. malaccensis]|uniref:(wild Malaysian banana) hypothetical protein n=1 Tax=Musa acuminata subsp. malaccensis TaxID=214687 RepID=A0A804HTK3_MUSAM|nr:unnamed protein product [Musa acuminata subsp. malaccensis]
MVLGIFVTVPSGYHGNPYVAHGCQDIDEWSDKDQNPCHGICQNLPGSYNCFCRRGTHGDAFNGPCTQHQKLQSSAKEAIGKSPFSTMTFIFVEDLITHLISEEDMIPFTEESSRTGKSLPSKNLRSLMRAKRTNLEKLEVPKFVSNGTLFRLIHDNNNVSPFSLATRLRIALAYLHSSTSSPIIHGDVKSSNILDENYASKVSNFGASKLVLN